MSIDTVLMTDIHKLFCANLSRLRKAQKLTQQDMADKLIITLGAYQNLEYGFKYGTDWPRPERIRKLARALNCDTVDFFSK